MEAVVLCFVLACFTCAAIVEQLACWRSMAKRRSRIAELEAWEELQP